MCGKPTTYFDLLAIFRGVINKENTLMASDNIDVSFFVEYFPENGRNMYEVYHTLYIIVLKY